MKALLYILCICVPLLAQRTPTESQIQGVSGNGNYSVTTSGAQTQGACVVIDANGNHVPNLCVPTTPAIVHIVQTVTTGTTILYTCPAATNCFVTNVDMAWNSSGSTVTSNTVIVHGSTTYATSNVGQPGLTGAVTTGLLSGNFMLLPGDSIGLTASGTFTVHLNVAKWSGPTPVKTAWLFGTATGNNLMYTVPAGKSAAGSGANITLVTLGTTAVFMGDPAGAAGRTYSFLAVPSGQSPSAVYTANTGTISAGGRSASATIPALASGDSFWVTVSAGSAQDVAFINFLEY